MTVWCSDIDGVLVNSREMVIESYKLVGVDMPIQAWGQPWHVWLPSAVRSYDVALELHKQKTEAYAEMLKNGAAVSNKLPFAEILMALEKRNGTQVFYVTGAAREAGTAVLWALGLNSKNLVAVNATTQEREGVFRELAPTGVYIDDRIEGQAPATAAGWSFIWAKQDW